MSIPAPRPANPTPKEVLERRDELVKLVEDHLREDSGLNYETIDKMDAEDPNWVNDMAEMLITGGWISFPPGEETFGKLVKRTVTTDGGVRFGV